jgi:hypothetical protein
MCVISNTIKVSFFIYRVNRAMKSNIKISRTSCLNVSTQSFQNLERENASMYDKAVCGYDK